MMAAMKTDDRGAHGIYEASFRKGADLLKNGDHALMCAATGARLDGDRVRLTFFTDEISIGLRDAGFDPPSLSSYEQILVLHYLTTLGGSGTKGDYVSFKNLPGASFYESTYRRRGPERILALFGDRPDFLIEAAGRLGGERAGYGDASARIRVFPRVEAVVVLFKGDEEFPPEANILYKDDIVNFLPLEDVAVLSGLVAGRLKRALHG